MTRRSFKVGIRGGEGRARSEAWALLDYDTALPPEGGPVETGGLAASNPPLLEIYIYTFSVVISDEIDN